MADLTVHEATDQAKKACAYFGKVLGVHGKGFIAVEVDGVVLVVANGDVADALTGMVENGRLGARGKLIRLESE